MPIDPVSNGTWVAVNDAGLAMTLVNVYAVPHRDLPPWLGSAPPLSRGTIIPSLLAYSNAEQALQAAAALVASRFPPFRLILLDRRGNVGSVRSDGMQLFVTADRIGPQPVLITTSGLGDDVVDGPRRELFNEMFTPGANWVAQQDRFHRHQWPDRPTISVCMSRAEARTVSLTVIDMSAERVALTYFGEAPNTNVTPVTRSLQLHPTDE